MEISRRIGIIYQILSQYLKRQQRKTQKTKFEQRAITPFWMALQCMPIFMTHQSILVILSSHIFVSTNICIVDIYWKPPPTPPTSSEFSKLKIYISYFREPHFKIVWHHQGHFRMCISNFYTIKISIPVLYKDVSFIHFQI